MSKKLEVKVKTELSLPYNKLNGIQGALKMMPEEHFRDLRESFLKDGIDFAWTVWKDKKGKWWIIDGHGRWAVVKHMAEEEGFTVPKLPCVETMAKNFEEAKLKVLRSSSAYHVVTKQGLYEFMSGAGIGIDQLEKFHIPEISIPEFKMEFFDHPEGGTVSTDQSTVAEALEVYKNNTIKQIVLYYPNKEYEQMLGKLDKLLHELKCSDYSEVVWKLANAKR